MLETPAMGLRFRSEGRAWGLVSRLRFCHPAPYLSVIPRERRSRERRDLLTLHPFPSSRVSRVAASVGICSPCTEACSYALKAENSRLTRGTRREAWRMELQSPCSSPRPSVLSA